MNSYNKRILDLIRTDLITMNGNNNNMKTMGFTMILICGGLAFITTPVFGVFVPLFLSGFFVPMIFQNEIKYHSEKMFSLLPIERKDLVRSRYILCCGVYFIADILFFLLMLIALKLKLSYKIMGEEAAQIDIISMIVKKSNGAFKETGLLSLMYFAVVALGCIWLSSNLRNYFRDNSLFEQTFTLHKKGKFSLKNNLSYIVIFGIILLYILVITGTIPAGAALSVITGLISELARAAGGIMLMIVMLTMGIVHLIYSYICTVIDYENKEL